jgi:hypothetical protein
MEIKNIMKRVILKKAAVENKKKEFRFSRVHSNYCRVIGGVVWGRIGTFWGIWQNSTPILLWRLKGPSMARVNPGYLNF